MEYRSSLFVGIIILLFDVFGASTGLENSTVKVSESSEVIPVQQINCSTASGPGYHCVKIEDCKTNRREGDQQFCKWDGTPTHVCCSQNSSKPLVEPSQTRYKRGGSTYFDDDFRPSSRFDHRHHGWSDEDDSWERPWRVHRPFNDRFGPDRDRDYKDDVETNYDEYPRNSIHRGEPECGVLEDEKRGKVYAATVGGSPVQTAASTPWMAAVGQSRTNGQPHWYCGGALISRKIVITAAHCITERKANLVRVGELDLTSNTEPAEPQDSEIESSVVHPDYKLPRHYHDIAIIRLKNPVRYTKYVRPICLPPNDENSYENSRVTLTGWGDVEYGGPRSPVLQEVQITVISNSECNSRYGDPSTGISNARTLPNGIINSQMCAADENGGRDACQGDSGGPIVKKAGRKRMVVGIVSSGLGCGSKIYPGIYTRVSYYLDWIRSFL